MDGARTHVSSGNAAPKPDVYTFVSFGTSTRVLYIRKVSLAALSSSLKLALGMSIARNKTSKVVAMKVQLRNCR